MGRVPEKPIVAGYIFPPGSSFVKVLYLSQEMKVLILLLKEFLRFAEQACNSLQHGSVRALVFVLIEGIEGRICRRGSQSGGEYWVRCILVFLFARSRP